MRVVDQDINHRILVEDVEDGIPHLHVIHPPYCMIYVGCFNPGEETHFSWDPCKPGHHVHTHEGCAVAYEIEAVGVVEALLQATDRELAEPEKYGLGQYIETFKKNIGHELRFWYKYHAGTVGYFEPEYESELEWDFMPEVIR